VGFSFAFYWRPGTAPVSKNSNFLEFYVLIDNGPVEIKEEKQ
jgi:hypothetical protein